MRGRIRVAAWILCMSIVSAIMLPFSAVATEGDRQTGKKAALMLAYEYSGVEFQIYQVADEKDVLTEKFQDCGQNKFPEEEEYESGQWREMAVALIQYVRAEKTQPDQTKQMGAGKNRITIEDLEAGIYLVAGSSVTTDQTTVQTPNPFLVRIKSGEIKYCNVKSIETIVGNTSKTVRKRWDDRENHFGLRPESVTVQLKRIKEDGSLAPFLEGELSTEEGTASAELREDNGWTYTWENLPDCYQEGDDWKVYTYTVSETPDPAGYYTPVYGEWSLPTAEKDQTPETEMIITNSLNVARLQIKKMVDNGPNQDTESPDQNAGNEEWFFIKISAENPQEGQGFSEIQMALARDEQSGYMEVPVSSMGNGTAYIIEETMPMEYKKASTFLTWESAWEGFEGAPPIVIHGNKIVLKPGASGTIVVHNESEHKNYFHSISGEKNQKDNCFSAKKSRQLEPQEKQKSGGFLEDMQRKVEDALTKKKG